MEAEVETLLRTSRSMPHARGMCCARMHAIVHDPNILTTQFWSTESKDKVPSRMNIEEMYTKVRTAMEDGEKVESKSELSREAFWREMNQTEDSFETIARFFAKGVIQ